MMKKSMGVLALILLLGNTAKPQEIDHKRMDRDLEIAENILLSLIKNSEKLMFHTSPPKGNYISDYGVILKISGSSFYFNSVGGNSFIFNTGSDDFSFNFEDYFSINDDEVDYEDDYEEVYEGDEDEDDYVEYFSPDIKVKGNKFKFKTKSKEKIAELRKKGNETLKAMMIDFLVDYADLIGQLKPEHKILIASGRADTHFLHSESDGGNKITAEVIKSDLSSHRSGKITREQLIERIKISEESVSKKETDLELLSTIFRRLYKPDLSDTYYVSSGLYYERLEGFGVIYNMKVYSSTSNRGRYRIVTQDMSGLTLEERNKRVNELYPQFEKGLKENILDYGKTLKSLEDSENLMFKVRLTECKKCSMPKSIDVTVSKSVLKDFNSGKLSKSAALNKVTVKKYD